MATVPCFLNGWHAGGTLIFADHSRDIDNILRPDGRTILSCDGLAVVQHSGIYYWCFIHVDCRAIRCHMSNGSQFCWYVNSLLSRIKHSSLFRILSYSCLGFQYYSEDTSQTIGEHRYRQRMWQYWDFVRRS